MNVVIIGAGVAGLSIGWRLFAGRLRRYIRNARSPRGRTWRRQGAGVTAERKTPPRPSAIWPSAPCAVADLAAELEAASGHSVFLHGRGADPGRRRRRAGVMRTRRKATCDPGPAAGAYPGAAAWRRSQSDWRRPVVAARAHVDTVPW